jgi:uncharacterized membrane protein YadS
VGRDVWIGIWAFVLARISVTRWETIETHRKPAIAQIWWRFPKFVIGFLAASLFITYVARNTGIADYDKILNPILVGPVKDMRTWAFIFCFLSIGLTTRFSELSKTGRKPFLAFSGGVVVNVVLGFVLSVVVFGSYWQNLTR